MSSRNLCLVATLGAIGSALGPVSNAVDARVSSPSGFVACQGSGYAERPETEIRAGPSADAPLLATVSPRGAGDDNEVAGTLPEFEIRGYREGWFLIAGTSYGDYGDEPQPRLPLYSGEGWMRGRDITGQVLPGRLHRAPSEKSRSRRYGVAADAVVVKHLVACQGYWVKVVADIGTGWVPGLCGNQVTTCN